MARQATKHLFKKPLKGDIKTIFDWFIYPLFKHKPFNRTFKDFFEDLLHVDTRFIVRYYVKRPFKVPGRIYLKPTIPTDGLGKKTISKDAVVFVRHDKTRPDVFDLEAAVGQGGTSTVFRLTEKEFRDIRPHLALYHREWKKGYTPKHKRN